MSRSSLDATSVPRNRPSGVFITFEGGDGVGKTTQATLLEKWLGTQGRSVIRTREPGGTDVGELLREIVLHHRGEVSARAEALMYAADRAQHVEAVVRPALEAGAVVLQDRYLDSSVAYQGSGRKLGRDEIRNLSLWATQTLLPDVTILLDLDPVAARDRLDAAGKPFDRLEAEKASFHERIRQEFLQLAEDEPDRFAVIDASRPVEEVAEAIRARVRPLLG